MGLMELPRNEPGQLIITPHPMLLDGQRNLVWEARAGESLYALLMRNVPELDGQPWAVSVDGVGFERDQWHCILPKQGQIVEVRGGVGKAALMVVAMVALTYFTFGLGTATTGMWGAAWGASAGGLAGAVLSSGMYIAGSMLINKVLGPKPPKTRSQEQDSVYSLSSARNQLRQYEPIPLLFGRVRLAPDLLSQPYTWYQGNDQYLGMLLCAGVNVGRIEPLYNNDTLLSSYEGAQVFHSGYSQMPDETIPLYSNADVIDGAQLLDTGSDPKHTPSAWVERTSSANSVRLIVGLEYQLYDRTSKGGDKNNTERVDIQYRASGTEAWQNFGNYTVNSSRTKAYRVGYAKDVPQGKYDVRVRTAGLNTNGSGAQASFTWSTLTSVQVDDGDYTGLSRTGVQLKATGQLNGSPDELRTIGYADPVPVWDGNAWSMLETSNPGAQILAYARGIRRGGRLLGGMALDEEQIDIASLKAFMLHCAANGYTYDNYIKDARNHDQILSAVALAGFGHITWAGGRLGVVWAAQDQPLSGVVNMGTVKKGQFQVDYSLSNAADGIEYTYIDGQTWEPKTLRVPAPGVTTMLNPAQVTGEGVTTEQHAARMARWHLGQSLYQYKDISYSTDIEHLSYQRMSVLAMQHDMTQWGFGGRVSAASDEAGKVSLMLDEEVPAPASGNAYIGLRLPGERVYRVLRVAAFSGKSKQISLADPWPSDAALPGNTIDNPAHDTLWIYDFKQTPGLRVRVVSIEPESDLKGASVHVVAEGPEFWQYVLTGDYIPSPNASLQQTRPVASNLRITEQQVVQGNTSFTELTATFDISGPVGNIVVRAAAAGQELEEVAQTGTRTATWRIPRAGVYNIVVRAFSPEGEAGVAVSATYITAGADVPPVLVDLFDVEQRSGGVRLYTWGWLSETIQSPDFAGVEIRYVAGKFESPEWDTMTPVGDTGYHTAAFEAVVPDAGSWTFACRSRNSAGVLSSGMRLKSIDLNASLGEVITEIGDTIAQETIDRFNADAKAVLDAVLQAGQYTDQQVAALNGVLEDIVGADEWNNTDTYPVGDFVRHNNVMWRALVENANVEPGTGGAATWQEIGDYTSVGDALAAAISMSTSNASDIAVEAQRIESVIARMPAGNSAVASQASVSTLQQALIDETSTRAQQIGSVQASLGNKADAGAVQLLEGRVGTVEGQMASQSQAITKVSAKLNTIGVNRLRNPSFLNRSIDGWDGGAYSLNTQWSERLGGYHIFNAPGPGQRYIASQLVSNGDNTAVPGEKSTLAMTVYCDGPWFLSIQYRNEAGVILQSFNSPTYPSTAFPATEYGWRRVELTSGAAPASTAFVVAVLWATDTVGHLRMALPMLVLGESIGSFSDDKSPVYQAQALTTLTSRVTPLEATAIATTAAIASLGGSSNLFENSEFSRIGTENNAVGWGWAWNPGGWNIPYSPQIAPGGSGWEPSGGKSLGGSKAGAVTSGSYGVVYQFGTQVQAGKRYILSMLSANHRCTTALAMRFNNSSGANIHEPLGLWSTYDGNGGANLINWEYRFLSVVAPANATTLDAGLWVNGTGQSDPYFWFTRPMLEEASDTQTKPSPWAPGSSSKQIASSINTLSASINATTGKVNAVNGVYLDVNGYVSGTVSENNGQRSSFSILASIFRVISSASTGLEWQNGYLRAYSGSIQLILGINFGSSSDLCFWYGPNVGTANCTKANGTIWFDNTGGAYFGGSLSAGTKKNAVQTTTTVTTGTSLLNGPFGTNGGTRTVTLSFNRSHTRTNSNMGNDGFVAGSGANTATVRLYRAIGNGAEALWQTLSVGGGVTIENEFDGADLAYSGWSGSATYNDSSSSSQTVAYRAEITSFTQQAVTHQSGSFNGQSISQHLSIISVEP